MQYVLIIVFSIIWLGSIPLEIAGMTETGRLVAHLGFAGVFMMWGFICGRSWDKEVSGD